MNNWKEIKGVNLGKLRENRKALHQVMQIIGAVPRNVLPHDPTDVNASLEWSTIYKGFESIPLNGTKNQGIRVGFSFKSSFLYLAIDNELKDDFHMNGKSVEEGLEWTKRALSALGITGEKISLNLPYEIEAYDYSLPVDLDSSIVQECSNLFENTHTILNGVVEKHKDAYDIRCWPHHFDIATLLPIETDSKGEILKSIGIGLSPGDEGIEMPYIYVNIWPSVPHEKLTKNKLPMGQWSTNSWSGAVLTYEQLLKAKDQRRNMEEFVNKVTDILLSISK